MTAVIDVTDRPVFHLGPSTSRILYPSGVASGVAFGTAQVDTVVAPAGVGSAVVVGTAVTVAVVEPASVGASSGVAGSPSTTALVTGPGVASGLGVGQPQLDAISYPSGRASTVAFGTTLSFISMNPTGFSAAGTVGTPMLRADINPTGVAGTEQFGDADTVATVFIIPGPVDPRNDFGDPVVTKYGWVFRGPRNVYQWRMPPYKEYEGISLVKESGVWTEVAHPDLERTLSAQKYLPGGHDHVVSTSLKDELIGAGYTVTSEVVTTEDYET